MTWAFEAILAQRAKGYGLQTERWRPATWLEQVLPQLGTRATEYQLRAAAALHEARRCAVIGPHGLGKTALAAWLMLSFIERFDGRRDWKVVTTASSWTQLARYLWPEVRKWHWRRAKVTSERAAREAGALQLAIRGKTGEAFAVASRHPELIEGAHASAILFVFDEAKAIPEEMFDAAEGALTGEHAYAVATSTPGESRGRLYDICRRAPGYSDWHVIRVTRDEAIAAGRMSREWAEARRQQWGETSAMYRRRVLGEFAADEEYTVIPLDWVEAAQQRWRERETAGADWGALNCVGVDVGYGAAASTIAVRHGLHIARIETLRARDTMTVADRVVDLVGTGTDRYAVVDVVGYGAGVYDRLRQLGVRTWGFVAGARSRASTSADPVMAMRFANLRTEAWWLLRELLSPASGLDCCLPDMEQLTADLTTPRWTPREGRMIALEAKESLARRLGRSTDWGDAVVQAYYPPPEYTVEDEVGEEGDYEISMV